MLYFIKLLFPAVLLSSLATASKLDLARDVSVDLSERHLPSLTAVTVRSGIQKREEAFIPKRDCEHHYADHNTILHGAISRYATTSMKYSLPTINLEDIELYIADIQCSGSSISVEFRDYQTLNVAKKSWENVPEFFVITSHAGCNPNGERAPHLISSITYGKDIPITIFSVKRVSWKDAYETMSVSFGVSQGKYGPDSIRLHNDLRRRQLIPTGTISYPSVSSPTTSATSITRDISYQSPPGDAVFTFKHEDGSVEESVSVSCKNCSTSGTVEITEGVFSVNGSSFFTEVENFVHHGYFKAVANGVGAYIELDTTLSLSRSISFDNTLATFAIPGFQIPGIAAVGPMLELDLTGSIEIAAALDFTYGFELTVPDNSTIIVDIANITQSSSSGFNNAQVTALPLTASSPDFSLTLGLGIRAQLVIGVEILDGHGNLGAGMFIDMPQLSLSVSQIDSVNAQCEPVDGSSTVTGFLSTVFPNLTHVVPSANIDIGLSAHAGVVIPEIDLDAQADYTHTLAGTSFSLPTACLMWDGKSNAFTAPTTTMTTTGPSATGGGDSSKKTNMGARVVSNPVSELGGMLWTLGMLLSALFVAISL